MNDPQRRGRPKKHPADALHFKAESEVGQEESALENPTYAQHAGMEMDTPEASSESLDTTPPIVTFADTSGDAPGTEGEIEDTSDMAWKAMDTAKRSGLPVFLSKDGNGFGMLAFWKRTRAFANPTKKWEITGKWINFMTGQEIDFIPKYWRDRF